jgi:hypothetical protein
MTPLERAAMALYKQIGSDFDPFGEGEDAKWPEFVDEVRAVIQAIREPSERQKQAGMLAPNYLEDQSSRQGCGNIYAAMIDALLAEEGA